MLPRRASHDCRLGRAFPLGPRFPARSLALQSLRPTHRGKLVVYGLETASEVRGRLRVVMASPHVGPTRMPERSRPLDFTRFPSSQQLARRSAFLAGGIDAEVGDPNPWVELAWRLFKWVEILPIIGRHDGVGKALSIVYIIQPKSSLVYIVLCTPGRAGWGTHHEGCGEMHFTGARRLLLLPVEGTALPRVVLTMCAILLAPHHHCLGWSLLDLSTRSPNPTKTLMSQFEGGRCTQRRLGEYRSSPHRDTSVRIVQSLWRNTSSPGSN